MIPYYDAHTHLNDEYLFPNREELLQEFLDAWGKWLVNVGANKAFNQNWLKIAKNYKHIDNFFLWTTIWFHPYEVIAEHITEANIKEEMDILEQQYLDNKKHIYAIWECWIDTHYNWDNKMAIQQQLFKMQCDLAKKYDIPLVIHSREAFAETLAIIKEYTDIKIYFHCRGYDKAEIELLQKMFPQLRVGFCGNVSYKKAEEIRTSLHALDFTHILLETDAPYLSPQVVRWEKNKPSNVIHIYDFVAQELVIEREDLATIVEKNFERLYRD